MKAKLLTLVTLAALLVGGLSWTNSADARPWRGYYGGGYYGGPGVRAYYGPNYYAQPYRYYSGYGPAYYGPRFYGPRYYYGPTYYNPGYSSGAYLGAGPVRFYVR